MVFVVVCVLVCVLVCECQPGVRADEVWVDFGNWVGVGRVFGVGHGGFLWSFGLNLFLWLGCSIVQ